jgi:thymidylate synthase (FAD)
MNQQQIFVEYLDHMGSDLSVVNAARASFGKESEWINQRHADADMRPYAGQIWQTQGNGHVSLKPADANLIRFLATGYRTSEWADFLDEIVGVCRSGLDVNDLDKTKAQLTTLLHAYKRKAQHWAPFAHPHVQIRVSMPIFLARQFVKHQVGGVWSEESRRYISNEPGVWFPAEWHTRPADVKQGSGTAHPNQQFITDTAHAATASALHAYSDMLRAGVAPEEARTILPLNMMTTVVWTGSLLFWSRVCNQRVDSHAQLAAQELGKLISGIVEPLFPVSWKELTT